MCEKEIKLFDYQKEFYECNDRNIVLNWARPAGVTFTILLKILKENPSTVLGININLKSYAEKLSELQHFFNIKLNHIKISNDEITINNGSKLIKIIKLCEATRGTINNYVNWQLFSNCLSYDTGYKTDKNISVVHINNYDKKLQKFICGNTLFEVDYRRLMEFNILPKTIVDNYKDSKEWYNEFAIFDNPNGNITNDSLWRSNYRDRKEEIFASYDMNTSNKFLLDTLVKLETELDETENTKNTVLTRQNLLNMIIQINRELNNI